MKKFKLLGILAIMVFVVETIFSISGTIKDFKEGFEDGRSKALQDNDMNAKGKEKATYVVFANITPKEGSDIAPMKIDSTESTPVEVTQVKTYIRPSKLFNLFTIPLSITALLAIYGIYLLIRAFISISRRNVFTKKNVWRIRFACYSSVGLSIVSALQMWIIKSETIAQVTIPGYDITSVYDSSFDWTTMAMLILLTEIFAVSVKIKEDQDLTI